MNRSTAPLRKLLQLPNTVRLPGLATLSRCGTVKGSPGITSSQQIRHAFFSRPKAKPRKLTSAVPTIVIVGAVVIYALYPASEFQDLKAPVRKGKTAQVSPGPDRDEASDSSGEGRAWLNFANGFEKLSFATDVEWSKLSEKLVDSILPEWYKLIPGYVRKLQRELSMAPGSIASEIWSEAHDPFVNPEIRHSASVRVSGDLCDEEREFLARRKRIVAVALAKYLGLEEKDVHPDDVPVVAMCGSGGGLRALVAGTGSLLATADDGLFDCVTYLSGVSGSCWLQALYYSSITERNFHRSVDHLKARLGVHIAYPPVAFSSVISAPTNKYLLSGMVEKLKGDPKAVFGLVDAYGLLLAARLLVPKGELGVNEKDFKLSSQREYIRYGEHPLPIYTAVRHEIPETNASIPEGDAASRGARRKTKQAPWFQWFEVTPYEFFCEEFSAGIPTWAMGRKFKNGTDVPAEDGLHLPEIRMPFLLGTFGSAFCATLSHYYREIRPLVLSLSGLSAVDEMIYGHEEDLSKVHPINPATLPNFAFGMKEVLPKTVPKSVYEKEYIELMDAGMSNNLPIYPLLRPGRDVEVVIAFDASADIKTDNWLSVADGYARQRGITGWPVGIGWPKPADPARKTARELEEAQASSTSQADDKLAEAKADQTARRIEAGWDGKETDANAKYREGDESAGELGYCTVWVGTTQERTSNQLPPSKAVDDATSWRLMEPDAGLTVIYCPFLTNDKVPGVDPATSDYMSTWNFVYSPDQVDKVVALSQANYDESKPQIRAAVRAVYERKKRMRQQREARTKEERYRRLVRLGIVGKLGEGDHFS